MNPRALIILDTAAEDYKVVDPANEAKYNFNLDEVMAAAKQKSGNLFAGKTFVFTPSAPVAPVTRDLLKNVLQAHSGKVRRLCAHPCSY